MNSFKYNQLWPNKTNQNATKSNFVQFLTDLETIDRLYSEKTLNPPRTGVDQKRMRSYIGIVPSDL